MLILLLLAAPAPAADWPWPVDGAEWAAVEPARQVSNDIDKGGVDDALLEFHVRGSGFRAWLTCVHHGETGQRACAEFRASSYSHFRGYRVFASGPNSRAAVLLRAELPSCRGADVDDPHQGSMWMLHRDRVGVRKLRWYRGTLKRQSPTCLSTELAGEFTGGHTWHAQGDPTADSPAWSVVYEPNWTASRFKRAPRQKQGADRRFQLFSHRNAIAIFDRQKGRHAWVVNLEGHVDDDFKVDRWPTIDEVEKEGRDRFNVRVNVGAGGRQTVALNVVHLLYGRAPRISLGGIQAL